MTTRHRRRLQPEHPRSGPASPTYTSVAILALLLAFSDGVSAFIQGGAELGANSQRQLPRAPGTKSTWFYGSRGDDDADFLPTGTLRPRRGVSLASRLNYHDGNSADTADSSSRNASSASAGLLGNFFGSTDAGEAKNSVKDEEPKNQQVVDEYLEFLDRRYQRLHRDEKKRKEDQFHMLKWLTTQVNSDQAEEVAPENLIGTEQEQEDALYVLGVAGLASKRLLQKRHMVDEAESSSRLPASDVVSPRLDVVDAETVSPAQDLTEATRASTLALQFSAAFRKVRAYRRLLIRYEAESTRKAVQFVLRTILLAPLRSVQTLLKWGGGSKTVALTFAAVATCSMVALPVFQAIANELTVSGA